MAEDSVTFPVTPEITKSIGILRRSSMEKGRLSKNGEQVLPIYRRASTGSCHDFCKFGKKHAVEPKERHPIRKKSTKKLIDGQHSLDFGILPEKKNMLVRIAKPKNSSDCETCVADATNLTNHEKNPSEGEAFDEKKKKLLDKPKLSPHSKPQKSSIPKATKQQISLSSEKSGAFSKQALSNAKEKKFPAKADSFSKLKSMKVKPNFSSAQRNVDVKIGESTGTPKGTAKKVLIPQIVSLSPKSVNRVSKLNARKQKSFKVVSPLKNQNKSNKPELKQAQAQNVEVQEKTLYVIKMETESKSLEYDQNETDAFDGCSPNQSSSSPPNSQSFLSQDENQSEYAANEEDISSSEDNEIINNGKDRTLNENNKERPHNTVSPQEQDSPPSKLNFQRGKVVDIQLENNSPRRLKFRRGRVLWENQKVKNAQRRNFMRRETECEMEDTKPAPEVVLRHQDVQGKKEEQALFNNVIEETASKLVETRKSRVKALVGAFETVISLQEKKPSANNVN